MAAKKKKEAPANAEELKAAYYDAMRSAKVAGGLPADEADKVTRNQKAWDEEQGITPYLDDAEAETSPETSPEV
jgi:hypothetical protein